MTMAHRFAAVLITLIVAVGTLGFVSPAAQAGSSQDVRGAAPRTHNCVSNYEWNQFDIGDTQRYVHALFDITGYLRWQHGRYQKRAYAHCGAVFSKVVVVYWWNGRAWKVYRASRS
jgi:hypothetical protein